MRSYIERAKDFIEQVYPYINSCHGPWGARPCIRKFNEDFDRKVRVGSGLSRIALITSDYVVKFDYNPEEVESVGGCENEIAVYAQAKEAGLAHLFAEITPYYYKDRAFYIMPRINGIGSGQYYAEKYMTAQERMFCRNHRITDLHSGNYGFRNGHVCLVDYACHLSYESGYDEYLENQTGESSW